MLGKFSTLLTDIMEKMTRDTWKIFKFNFLAFGLNWRQLPNMVMELLECNLWQYLDDCQATNTRIPLSTKLSILRDVAKGLVYLHKQKQLAHRDLTTTNILLTSSNKAKIGDFGQSRHLEGDVSHLTSCPGNATFMPPEVSQEHPEYDLSLDCFSYGCVILHTIVQKHPAPLALVKTLPDGTMIKVLTEVERRQKWFESIKGQDDLKFLVCRCLDNNKDKRRKLLIF